VKRIPESELMDDPEGALAYASADFEEPHQRVIEIFCRCFKERELRGRVLDLGCGPGDVTLRFAARFPESEILAVDGAGEMIRLAKARQAHEPRACNIQFVRGIIPGAKIPDMEYEAIISSSFLHHLQRPYSLWETIKGHAVAGTIIFVIDLFRPASKEEAQRLVDVYAHGEPDILKRDFYNSLLAAFRPEEVRTQLREAGLAELTVGPVSDRHMIIYGIKE